MLARINRIWFVLILVSVGLASAEAQWDYAAWYNYPEFTEGRSNQLLLHVSNTNFVKNNEYASPFVQGETLIGYGLEPTLTYYAGSKLRVRGGVFLQQFSGLDHYNQVRPILSAQLRLSPSVDLVFGSLRGHVHHQVIEPLLEPERQFTHPVENGFQVLMQKPWLWLDAWLDWEQFIQPGDRFPERFTAGLSAKPHLINDDTRLWQVTLPVNLMAVHRGGEISDYPEPVQTVVNVAGGVELVRSWSEKGDNLGLFGYAIGYRNLNDEGPLDINNGNAWYGGLKGAFGQAGFMAGYFNGHNFISGRGRPLFRSVSSVDNGLYDASRELLTAKLGYDHTFLKKIKFSFLLESYYDLSSGDLDFTTGLYLTFSPTFFITEASFL